MSGIYNPGGSGTATPIYGYSGGRLTLTSGVPVTTSDVTGATNVYYTPYLNDQVAIYNGSAWAWNTFSELTLALGTLVNAQAYDVFVYDNSGLTLEAVEWANATVTMTIASPCVVTWTSHGLATGNSITFTNSGGALPTGVTANTQYWITKVDANTFKLSTSLANVAAGTFINTSGSQSGTHTGHSPTYRATALTTQDGVQVKSGATTHLYLGTFMTTSTTTTEDSFGGASQSGGKRFLWNMYNRVERPIGVKDTTSTWTCSVATRQANGATGNKVEFVCGLAIDQIDASVIAGTQGAAGGALSPFIGLDSTSADVGSYRGHTGGTSIATNDAQWRSVVTSIGYHAIIWLEGVSAGSGSITALGSNSGVQSGLLATVMA